MAYAVENGMWRAVFAVPNDIVDLHLKLCGEVPLKVLLALLRYNGGLDESSLAAVVGKPVTVIREAVEYLVSEGIISGGEKSPVARLEYTEEADADAETKAPARRERKITTAAPTERRRLLRDEINQLADNDEAIAWLLQEAQQVLGKTLGASATETIVSLYSYYDMKPDLIMMVLQYCKGIDKTSMPYIEKIAASWVENEIRTHEQAEREIQRLNQMWTSEGRIKSAFGIYDRSLVPNERKYIPVWLEDYGFDIPLIRLAYERAVEAKGKLSFPYINGILTNWHKNGIKTPAEALRDMREDSHKKTTPKSDKPTSYDLGELESLLDQGTL